MLTQAFDFEAELIKLIPQLRAFALVMTRGRDGDDLMQDTLVRALRSQHTFVPGTNLKAWAFTILRNQFISAARRRRPESPQSAEDLEVPSPPAQEAAVALGEFARILHRLPEKQREALLMVGANGFSYEEAAAVLGSSVGTIKSRVSRARAFLQPHFLAAAPNGCTPVSDMREKKRRRRRGSAPVPEQFARSDVDAAVEAVPLRS